VGVNLAYDLDGITRKAGDVYHIHALADEH
jgi:hypothetical protein